MTVEHDACIVFLDKSDDETLFMYQKSLGQSFLWIIVLIISAFLPSLTFGPSSRQLFQTDGNCDRQCRTWEALFKKYGCYECHGSRGQIASRSGPALAPDLIPFDAFAAYVREPKGSMPPYVDKVVSQKDLADIYAFLQTTPRPPGLKKPFQY